MKKPQVLLMGMLAMALTFGFMFTACSNGNDDAAEIQQQQIIAAMIIQQQQQQAAEDAARDPAIRAKWYANQACTDINFLFELKTGGDISIMGYSDAVLSIYYYTASNGVLTIHYKSPDIILGTSTYEINGKELRILSGDALPTGTYYKR